MRAAVGVGAGEADHTMRTQQAEAGPGGETMSRAARLPATQHPLHTARGDPMASRATRSQSACGGPWGAAQTEGRRSKGRGQKWARRRDWRGECAHRCDGGGSGPGALRAGCWRGPHPRICPARRWLAQCRAGHPPARGGKGELAPRATLVESGAQPREQRGRSRLPSRVMARGPHPGGLSCAADLDSGGGRYSDASDSPHQSLPKDKKRTRRANQAGVWATSPKYRRV